MVLLPEHGAAHVASACLPRTHHGNFQILFGKSLIQPDPILQILAFCVFCLHPWVALGEGGD